MVRVVGKKFLAVGELGGSGSGFFDGSLAAAVLFLKIASLNFYFKCQCRIFFFL